MNKQIRILHVVPELGYGGVEKVVTNYYAHIDHKKYAFDYITHGAIEDYHQEIISKGSKIFYFGTIGKVGFKEYKRQIKEQIDLKRYDIVHIHTGNMTGVYAYLFKWCGARKIVSHAHVAKLPNPKHKLLMPILRFMSILFSDVLIACGGDAGRFCFGKAKFQILPNGIDYKIYKSISQNEIETIKDSFGINQDTYIIGHVGRFSKQKNHLFLVQIVHDYLKSNKNTKFILVGDGPDKDYIDTIVRNNGDSENVIFAGIRNDVERLMKMFDLFLLPSLFEGLPVVGIEAQAAGTPCLFSDTIDNSVNILEEYCEFLPIDRGTEIWIDAINRMRNREIAGNADLYDILCSSGYEITATAYKLEEIYNSLIGY